MDMPAGSTAQRLEIVDFVAARRRQLRNPGEALYRRMADEAKDNADRARLSKLAADDTQAEAFGVHDVLDVLMEFPSARPRVGDFVAVLGRMQPRLYSIASSPPSSNLR